MLIMDLGDVCRPAYIPVTSMLSFKFSFDNAVVYLVVAQKFWDVSSIFRLIVGFINDLVKHVKSFI